MRRTMAKDAKSLHMPGGEGFDARAMADEHTTKGSAIPARVVSKVCRIMTLLSVVCLVAMPLAPTLDWPQKFLTMGLVAVVTVISLAVHPLAGRQPERAFSILIGSSMLVIFGVMFVDPTSIDIDLVPMLLCVVAITIVSGSRVGYGAAAIASVLTTIAVMATTSPLNWFKVVLFVIFAFGIVAIVDGMTRDRRRLSRNLARFYEALRASSVSSPDLGDNLDAIVASVNNAVGSAWCSVVLLRDGLLEIAAPTAALGTNLAAQVRAESQGTAIGGPVTEAIASQQLIVVNDVTTEARFPVWKEVWAPRFLDRGMPCLVVVPLLAGESVLGALTVHATTTSAFDGDDIALLRAYAEQMSLVILRAQAFEAEKESAQRLAEADALKSEFLAMVSHELRTPLTAAKGFIDTVLLHWDRLDDDRRKDLLRRSSSNANELTRLISQLLDFARIDADRVDLKPLSCNLRELVDRVTADIAPVVSERTIAVDVDERVKVVTDPDAFNHVLVNLITNANKFSPVGSTIHITAVQGPRDITVAVADQGMGIAPDELEKVFERFYQSERTNMTRKGTGIGLAIVKRFVEHQGGRIWAESVLGEGATFKFTVALAGTKPVTPPGVSSAAVAAAADIVRPPEDGNAGPDADAVADRALPTQS